MTAARLTISAPPPSVTSGSCRASCWAQRVAALGAGAPALYYVTMPPGRMRALVDAVAARVAASRLVAS